MHNFRQSAIGDAAGHSLPLVKYLRTVGCQADPARGKPDMLYHRNQNDYSIIYNAVNRNNLTTMSWILVQPGLPVRDTDFPSCKNFMEVGARVPCLLLLLLNYSQELRQELGFTTLSKLLLPCRFSRRPTPSPLPLGPHELRGLDRRGAKKKPHVHEHHHEGEHAVALTRSVATT